VPFGSWRGLRGSRSQRRRSMARLRECIDSLLPGLGARPAVGAATELRDGAPHALAAGSDPQRFYVKVTGVTRGMPTMFIITVRRGDAVWQVQRRFRQVWSVHNALIRGLGNAALDGGFPKPPPRTTLRSILHGHSDRQFLEDRARRLERYLEALIDYIPCVEQCEALYKFLCFVNLPRWDLDLRYGEMVGGGSPPVDASAVAKLKSAGKGPLASSASSLECPVAPPKPTLCVVCQEEIDLSKDVDVRELPCGHQFHFACIARWLQQRNTCCVCQSPAVPSAPRLSRALS